jgi:hypothetical protein
VTGAAAAGSPVEPAASAVLALADLLSHAGPETTMRALASLRLAVCDDLVSAVVEGRAQGMTWQEVGDAIGVTRQAAQQLYGRFAPPPPGRPPQELGVEAGDGCHPQGASLRSEPPGVGGLTNGVGRDPGPGRGRRGGGG